MVERIPDILQRLASLEKGQEMSAKMLASSVDDIKATIKSEISDLKGEHIGDLRIAQAKLLERLDRQAERIQMIERTQGEWKTGAGVAEWMIRFAILLVGAIGTAGAVFGYKHIGGVP
jgi:hypothetical protein